MNEYPRVILVTGANCSACEKQKRDMKEAGIPFDEIDAASGSGKIVSIMYQLRGLPTVIISRGGRDKAEPFPAGTVPVETIKAALERRKK